MKWDKKHFFKMGHSQPLFLYSCLFLLNVEFVDKILPMMGFKPWISGVGSDWSTNWATTTARQLRNNSMEKALVASNTFCWQCFSVRPIWCTSTYSIDNNYKGRTCLILQTISLLVYKRAVVWLKWQRTGPLIHRIRVRIPLAAVHFFLFTLDHRL